MLICADILIDAQGHIKVTDFGTSSMAADENSSRNSFVGTQDYVSPEVLSGEKQATKACDLWAVGCMIYQMLSGRSPFRAATEYLTFELIMGHCKATRPLEFPPVIHESAREIILAFLRVSDTERLGAGDDSDMNGYAAVKGQRFFDGVLWGTLGNQTPPYQPDSSKFPSTDNMRDGALDEWDLEGEPTALESPHPHGSDDELGSPSSGNLANESEEFDAARSNKKWKRFLYENEKQVFSGLIYKRKVLFDCSPLCAHRQSPHQPLWCVSCRACSPRSGSSS